MVRASPGYLAYWTIPAFTAHLVSGRRTYASYMERIGIVFGAGASFGAGAIWPSPPPLGTDLYCALVTAYPHSWGQLPSKMDKVFAGSFEEGMDALWNDSMSSALLVDMTRFFLQFEPPSDHSDNYTRLVKALIASSSIVVRLQH